MNNARQRLGRLIIREFSKTSARNADTEVVNPAFKRLKENQKKFGLDDGTPVHLKGGIKDVILYHATVGLTAVGLGLSFHTFYLLITKK